MRNLTSVIVPRHSHSSHLPPSFARASITQEWMAGGRVRAGKQAGLCAAIKLQLETEIAGERGKEEKRRSESITGWVHSRGGWQGGMQSDEEEEEEEEEELLKCTRNGCTHYSEFPNGQSFTGVRVSEWNKPSVKPFLAPLGGKLCRQPPLSCSPTDRATPLLSYCGRPPDRPTA